jgi:8-oxo-dGTP pyrophosphatase MutT (NUDIX family)
MPITAHGSTGCYTDLKMGVLILLHRACVALFSNDKSSILMVKHNEGNRFYWTLPGGAIEPGESAEECATREVKEETGLDIEIKTPLFDDSYMVNGQMRRYRCFLGICRSNQIPQLGFDPEDVNLPNRSKTLQDLQWKAISEMSEDLQIKQVLDSLIS